MQILGVSNPAATAEAAAKAIAKEVTKKETKPADVLVTTTTFKGYEVNEKGEVQGGYLTSKAKLADVQKDYNEYMSSLEQKKEEVVAWFKKPFVMIGNGISNVFGAIKAFFVSLCSCFSSAKAEDKNVENKDEAKKDEAKKAESK